MRNTLKTLAFVLVLVLVGLCAPANAQTISPFKLDLHTSMEAFVQTQAAKPAVKTTAKPLQPCGLGTNLSVNKNRQMAPGEYEVLDPGGRAYMTELAAPGSHNIVTIECDVPRNTPAVCGPDGCWIKICGNNFQPMGRVLQEFVKDGIDGVSVTSEMLTQAEGPCKYEVGGTYGVKFTDGDDRITYACNGKPGISAAGNGKNVVAKNAAKKSDKVGGFPLKKTLVWSAIGGVAAQQTYYWWPCITGHRNGQ